MADDRPKVRAHLAMVRVVVYGKPAPAGSKKPIRRPPWIVDDSKASAPWKRKIAEHARTTMGERPPLEGPLVLDVVFVLDRPKGHLDARGNVKASARQHPTVKPDALKLARAVEDALTGIVYTDDALIVVESIRKRYVTSDAELPHADIRVSPLEELEPLA